MDTAMHRHMNVPAHAGDVLLKLLSRLWKLAAKLIGDLCGFWVILVSETRLRTLYSHIQRTTGQSTKSGARQQLS